MNGNKNPNISTLNKVYQNSRTAIEAIDCLLPKTKNADLKKAMASQILGHHNLIKSSAAKLHEVNHNPHEPNLFNMTAAIHLKSAVDGSDSHIAEMLIENSTAGIIEIQRNLNKSGNGKNNGNVTITQAVSDISSEAISFEQANITKMRGYL